MATYKGIQGYTVQKLATDPTASEAAGQLWYNSTSGKFKISVAGAGVWASGTAINTGRTTLAAAGITTAGLIFGGSATALTETWNGSTWTEVGNLPGVKAGNGGFGTNTAAVSCGGTPAPTNTTAAKWDGTSWTATGVLNSGTNLMGASGTQTAGMKFGGDDYDDETETFDGSTWTEEADLNLARKAGGPSSEGTVTASLYAGGEVGPAIPSRRTPDTETWNGTSWTEESDLNTERSGCAGFGTSTAAIVFAGQTPITPTSAITEEWNGTSWTEVADLATGIQNMTGLGTSGSGFSIAGHPALTAVEEWTVPDAIKTFTAS